MGDTERMVRPEKDPQRLSLGCIILAFLVSLVLASLAFLVTGRLVG